MKKYVIAYTRISCDDEGESIANQRMIIYDFMCKIKEENKSIIDIIDNGYSGSNIYRPGLQRIIQMINKGQVESIYVKDISRLCRNYIDLGTLINMCRLKKVSIISVADNCDITYITKINFRQGQKDGWQFEYYQDASTSIDFKGLCADFYSKDISIKTKSALDVRKNNGIYAIANVPYGYRKRRNNIEVHKEEASVVKKVFNEYLNSKSISKVIKYLFNSNIYPQKSKSKYWSYSTIKQMLSNEFYVGTMVFNKTRRQSWESNKRESNAEVKRIEKHHESIIAKDIYEQVTQIIKVKKDIH
ncbi:MAG: recombinase family protein [Lachnospiraceae bacterium]|nr:recombinase family protein [Lachnospiraceae bacterium]